jgi:hypothetical protein
VIVTHRLALELFPHVFRMFVIRFAALCVR